MVVVNVFPDVGWETGDGGCADDEVACVPFCETGVGGVHVGGFHGGVLEVEEAPGGAVPVADAPDGGGVVGVDEGDCVAGCGGAWGDGYGAGVDFEFLRKKLC